MTIRLTVAQAAVKFLAAQYTERDGVEEQAFGGVFGIFGHGNVAGLGQALWQQELRSPDELRYFQARNEQAMVHMAVAYARMFNRTRMMICTSSIGPGATNMITGAALATINRLPVLLLPGDIFATRVADPVLQQLEHPSEHDLSVNDTFRPVSRFFDRVSRPEQLPAALFGAMRILTDPVETGAATIAIPQDVQAEAWEWPVELFERRVWHISRPKSDVASLARAVEIIRSSTRPLIVAGGGVHYSDATNALRTFAEQTGVPVAETQAGKGSLPYNHPQSMGSIGSTGSTAANALAREADVIIGVGTRYSDFTTASRTIFQNPNVKFVNINVASFDAAKHSAEMVVGDARVVVEDILLGLEGWSVSNSYRSESHSLALEWDATVERAYHLGHGPLPAQSEIIGAVNDVSQPRDVVVCAAGSMPGDLHKLWRTRDAKGYHVEYGYSCMGYEIAGGIGIRMADASRNVWVMVGDGSYLMMSQELVTAVQENIHVIIVLVQNHGFASIGALSEEVGSDRFGTWYRYRDTSTGRLNGGVLPVDLAANAESLGVHVLRAEGLDDFREKLRAAADYDGPVMVHVHADPLVPAPSSEAWWDVPVAEVSSEDATQRARIRYLDHKSLQRPLF
ncbi:MAG: 3D-(3,5/4)-trihydroxycyclohexane-1,2-dione acylhydrolase (decyclizing) [Acidobacteria bacterium]|nr:3D-(3,5/4)-trihydroxycyclohexane-1,2-dione acylhydrolase (decyclizing) [Acidobacteriota bacterium]